MPDNEWVRRAILLREIHRLDPSARDVSAKDLSRLARSLSRLTRTSVTKRLELLRSGGLIVLRTLVKPIESFELPIEPGSSLVLPEIGATLRLQRTESAREPYADGRHRRQIFQLPQGKKPHRFLVRNRRAGERFRPLGFRHQKKLNEFLIDRKIPSELRDRLPLLTWNGQIVWIGGVEVSDDFKVTDPAREVFEVTVEYEHG
ncbi:MAG TPA: tRNA lysidine(34) synthetase TilS, partial [Thermoanaerobaculia bacterium]